MAVFNGTTGNNTLSGSVGNVNDTLNGGLGNDIYKYTLGRGSDVINDSGGLDTIQFDDPNNLYTGWDIYRSGNNLVFDYNGQGRVTVTNQFLGASTAIEKVAVPDNAPYTISSSLTGTVGSDLLVGTGAAETLNGGSGDDLIFANQGNDTVLGGDGDDEIHAGAGNDSISGGNGYDEIMGGQGADTIDGGDGRDSALYTDQTAGIVANFSGQNQTVGSVTLANGSVYEKSTNTKDNLISIETIEGSKFADVFYGGSTNNNDFRGNAGNDIFYGGGANTSMQLGYYDDLAGVIINLGNASIIVNGVSVSSRHARDGWGNTDTFFLSDGHVSLGGSDYDDYIRGRDDMPNSWLNGGGGNDTIIGGADNDTLAGDNGNDVLNGGNGDNDTVFYDNGTDGAYGAIVNLSAAAITVNGITVASNHAHDNYGDTDTLISIEDVVGTFLNDYIQGSSGNNGYLSGRDGNDTINGGAGNDYLSGDNGNDVLNGGTGADTMDGGDGSDTYSVDSFSDFVRETNASVSSGGTDQVNSYLVNSTYTLGDFVENGRIMSAGEANLTGNGLNNLLYAGKGDNILSGGVGVDTVSYLYGASISNGVTINLGLTGVQNTAGSGIDILLSIDHLIGSNNSDALTGNSGNNSLEGLKGNDILKGAGGNDVLIGGADQDTLFGGTGNDTFDFNALSELGLGAARDTIADFTRSQDKIDLSTIDANAGIAGDQAFSLLTTTFTAAGQIRYGGGILSINTDGDVAAEFEVQLTGTVPLSLTATDFVL